MILVGRYLSPFVRRVAISLKLLGIPFEHHALSTLTDRDAVKGHNPLVRVPALVLDDGYALIDSGAILDYLDELAGPARALTPPSGLARREVNRLVAIAVGSAEKAVGSIYERTRRPEDKRHAPWSEQLDAQTLSGLEALESALGPQGWIYGDKLTQADVSAVAAYDFIHLASPQLLAAGSFPHLAALSARCNALPAFAETNPQA